MAVETWYKFNPDFTIKVLNNDNFTDYITDLPDNFNNLMIQHQSDIIRLSLLEKYGGVWIDSTIFLNTSLSNIWYPIDYDIGGFYADFSTTNNNYPVLENWMLIAKKNSKAIKLWKNEVFNAINYNDNQLYINNLEENGVDLQNIIYKNYLICHSAFLKVNYQHNFKLKVFPASKGPFKYLIDNNWDSDSAVMSLIKKSDHEIPDIIKIRGCERYYLDKYLSENLIEKNSIIDRILTNLK
jgi:hypothetical protein